MKRQWTVLLLLSVVGFGIGFFWAGGNHRPRIDIGGHQIEIDPRAVPDPKRTYTLQYWDYDLPLGSAAGSDPLTRIGSPVGIGSPAGIGSSEYRRYLEGAVAAFQKSYPRIKVAITLLDIVSGPDRLATALQHNAAPDVYGSAFQIPRVDYQHQIPVGAFLTPEEIKEYPLPLRRMAEQDQCLWALPRWTAPGLWFVDREQLPKYQLTVAQIRAAGWTWQQLAALGAQLPAGQALLAANPAAGGFFRQLAANFEPAPHRGNTPWNGRSAGAVLQLLGQIAAGRGRAAVVSYDFTARFLKGRALILAGVRPLFFPILRVQMPNLALLPVPGLTLGRNQVVTENGVLCVYRNQRTRGDDQIAAAVKFATFLSNYREVGPWLKMMVVPAAQSAASVWLGKAGRAIGPGEAAYLAEITQGGNLQNLNELPEYQTQIYPALLDFLAGRTSPDQARALMFDH